MGVGNNKEIKLYFVNCFLGNFSDQPKIEPLLDSALWCHFIYRSIVMYGVISTVLE